VIEKINKDRGSKKKSVAKMVPMGGSKHQRKTGRGRKAQASGVENRGVNGRIRQTKTKKDS